MSNTSPGQAGPARATAFDVLSRVHTGGFASDLLRHHSSGLASRDAGLASEIVFGVLRRQNQLDWLIEQFSGRPPGQVDLPARLALQMGLYQILHLDRIPPHAAVDSSVELVKRAKAGRATGFVNAVLRRCLRTPRIPDWPDRPTALALPAWMLARWEEVYGRDTAEAIAKAALDEPPAYIHWPDADRNGSMEGLTPVKGHPGAFRTEGRVPDGAWRMDLGAQSIVPLLELQQGQTFLDVCAAPGNKTAQALAAGVRAIACDRSLVRIRALRHLACAKVVLDAARPLPLNGRFDRILVDAPCSGTGTLGRNPEIKWRLQVQKLDEFQRLQVAILRNAWELLAPGGVLVYSTCSLEPEENLRVVEAADLPAAVQTHQRLPGLEEGDGFFAAVLRSQ